MIIERLKNEILKFCYKSYRNFWFLIKKKNLKNIDLSTQRWKWIKSRFKTRIFFFDERFFEIIRWLYDDFFDEFVFKIWSIFINWNFSKFDWISDFDRINLNDDFFQKTINSIMQFCWIMFKILINHINKKTMSFLNDVEIKKFKNVFVKHEKIAFDIRKKALKHIQWLNQILIDVARTNCTIFEKKSQFCCVEIKIIEFVCNENEKHFDTAKIIKIVKWSSCINIKKIRKFVEICVYYRYFVENFAIIIIFFYLLLKKNQMFVWKFLQQKIMNILKLKLMTFSILITINYEFEKKIILTIYIFKKNWNEIFMQFQNKLRHFFHYENDIWTEIETKYNNEKRICRAMLKCLKKLRFHFYDVHFVLKIDSKSLITQFNRLNTNFSKSFMIRWIA